MQKGEIQFFSLERRENCQREKKVSQEPVAMGPNTHTESLDRSQPGGWARRPSEGRRDRWGMWKGPCFASVLFQCWKFEK